MVSIIQIGAIPAYYSGVEHLRLDDYLTKCPLAIKQCAQREDYASAK
jgi:hypothetical protein